MCLCREQRRRFSPQFKAEAVQMVIETGKPIAEVARDLGIHDDPKPWSSGRTTPTKFLTDALHSRRCGRGDHWLRCHGDMYRSRIDCRFMGNGAWRGGRGLRRKISGGQRGHYDRRGRGPDGGRCGRVMRVRSLLCQPPQLISTNWRRCEPRGDSAESVVREDSRDQAVSGRRAGGSPRRCATGRHRWKRQTAAVPGAARLGIESSPGRGRSCSQRIGACRAVPAALEGRPPDVLPAKGTDYRGAAAR
jgi:hypothetical protein